MHGNNTDKRAVVHGLNTYDISADTQKATEPDYIDAEWEDIPSTSLSSANPETNTHLSKTKPQERIIQDLFNMAGPNETVSLTITRKPSIVIPPQAPRHYQANNANDYLHDTDTEENDISMILWILLLLAGILVVIKVIEFIMDNPVAVLLSIVFIGCLIGTFLLLKPKRGIKK